MNPKNIRRSFLGFRSSKIQYAFQISFAFNINIPNWLFQSIPQFLTFATYQPKDMIFFFESPQKLIYGVQVPHPISSDDREKLCWLFGEANALTGQTVVVDVVATVADAGGVTRAAGLLNLTQSAVSMQIKRLEQSLAQAGLARHTAGLSGAGPDELMGAVLANASVAAMDIADGAGPAVAGLIEEIDMSTRRATSLYGRMRSFSDGG